MNDLQRFFDAISEQGRVTRSNYHLTLGALIATLEKAPADVQVVFDNGMSPGYAMSYRGYYSDLAFNPCSDAITSGKFLEVARKALGATFEGYKGGDFVMGENTPLWASGYGDCGPAIVGINVVADKIVLEVKEVD